MDLYKQKYFNRRNWILENLSSLNLSPEEAIAVLMIDFCNEFNMEINIDVLARMTNQTPAEVDKAMSLLTAKGYLTVKVQNNRVDFNLEEMFKPQNLEIKDNDAFSLFESEFNRTLSQKEVTTIAEWLRIYDYEMVIDALREASIEGHLNMKYIDKMLASKDEQK